jgi:hypothetical protein
VSGVGSACLVAIQAADQRPARALCISNPACGCEDPVFWEHSEAWAPERGELTFVDQRRGRGSGLWRELGCQPDGDYSGVRGGRREASGERRTMRAVTSTAGVGVPVRRRQILLEKGWRVPSVWWTTSGKFLPWPNDAITVFVASKLEYGNQEPLALLRLNHWALQNTRFESLLICAVTERLLSVR